MLKAKKSYFIPIVGISLIILMGALLLDMPICNKAPIDFRTALFTAISGATTTGVSKVVLVDQFNFLGQLVIATMMELGAIGFIIFISFFWIVTNKKMKISDIITINDNLSSDRLGTLKEYSLFVLGIMLKIQVAGIILFAIRFIPTYGVAQGIWYSIFHTISAFANSGFDLISDSSFIPYHNDIYLQIVTIFVMLSGSVGVFTIEDLLINRKKKFKHLKAQTKIILVATAVMIIVPTILLKIYEPKVSLLNCIYTTISARSTGYSVVDVKTLKPESILLLIITMFIGGAPTSTAGGVKLLSISIIIATIFSTIRGNDETVIFWRKIPEIVVRRAYTILFLFLLTFFISGIILYFNTTLDVIQISFDSVSCLTNTGFSLIDYTRTNLITDIVMMALMFIGQIGPLSLVLMFVKSASLQRNVDYAEENMILW